MALRVTAWILLAIGLIVNIAFLLNPNAQTYPLWALLPILAALVLMIPIIRQNCGRRQKP